MSYNEIFNNFPQVIEAYILINTYEIYISTQHIKIKILKDLKNGKYSYSNSHHYHGSEQASPYASSICAMIDSESEALSYAIRELTSFYDENDKNAKWVKNESF